MDWFKKAVKPMDVLIAIVGVYLFANMDFGNLQTIDYIYAVCFTLWFILEAVRIYIYYQRRNEEPSAQEQDRRLEKSHNKNQHKHH